MYKLVFFLTSGMSLQRWDEMGIMDRETAIYRALRKHLDGLTIVSYGGRDELAFQERLPDISILCNQNDLSLSDYLASLPTRLAAEGSIPAVFKSNQVLGAEVAMQTAQNLGMPFVARCGYLYADFMEQQNGRDSELARQARELERRIFQGADLSIVTTKAMRERIVADYRLDPGKVRVIPNYVDTDRFRPMLAKRTKGRIAFVGRLEAQKNLFALLDAAHELPLELSFAGVGSLAETLKQKAAEQGTALHLCGTVAHEQLPDFLNSAEMFVLPSLYEGHPKVLIEAMACGMPVIGADTPGIRELIVRGETGLLCAPDAAAIRAAIASLSQDGDLAEKLARNAREFAVTNFSLVKIADTEFAVLKELRP